MPARTLAVETHRSSTVGVIDQREELAPRRLWTRGWPGALAALGAVWLLTPAHWPRWGWMWSVALAIYVGCKWLTWRRTPVRAPLWRHAAYLVAWPGMDAAAFLSTRRASNVAQPTFGEWTFGFVKLAAGVAFMSAAAIWAANGGTLLAGYLGIVGIVFTLHFGAFQLLSCLWRALGVQAVGLMNWPIAATSASDFWGRRWNLAFRDLVYRFLFRPLYPLLGVYGATLAVFLASGLVHEIVITLPAGGGYGGPTAFFLVQAAALLFERSAMGRKLGLARGWRGWLFAAATLLSTAPLLFPRPFIEQVILPMLRAMGGTP
jgi:alginate O-acetyltransferase complex protein AlgI